MAAIITDSRRGEQRDTTPKTMSPAYKPFIVPAWPEPPKALAPYARGDDGEGPTLRCPHFSGMGVVNQ